jgi:ABC-type branched-subunit amino acid transport system substrate-binding protein
MKSVVVIISAVLVVVASVIAGCKPAPMPLPAEILFGCLMSPSAVPTWGPNLVKAAQLGVEAVNSQGGINGKPLKLVLQDEGPTPASSLYAAHKLIEESRVQVILGGTTSEAVMILGPYLENKGVPLVSPSATSSTLSRYGWSRWVFRVPPGDSLQGGVAAKIIKENGYKHVAMLVQDSVYGRSIEEATMEFLRGISDIVISRRYDPSKLSYLADLNSVKDKKPDCVFHAGYYDDGAVIYAQAVQLGMDTIPWIAVDGVYDMPLDKYTEAAKFMEKAVTGTVPVPDMKSAVYSAFATRYQALYGLRPTIFCDTAYDGVNLIAGAIRQAGVYRGGEIRDAIGVSGNIYHGVSGTIVFNSSWERLSGIYGIWKVKMEGTQYQFEITGQPVNFTRSGQ